MNDNNSNFFRLDWKDISKGLAVAVLGVVIASVNEFFGECGIDVMCYDWQGILKLASSAGGAYLLKNLFSTSDGRMLGKIG